MTPSFKEKVLRITKKIPAGRITTYKIIARLIGRPKACRAVGNALNKSPGFAASLPASRRVPCHRVINSNGQLGGYNDGLSAKITLLKKEGMKINKGKIDLKKFGWKIR